ncbi:MAG: hypothetical protein KH196_00715 [Oscillospiraceae bacterium]|nr:hypothetical protein [Oscillospiraceae bacterium]
MEKRQLHRIAYLTARRRLLCVRSQALRCEKLLTIFLPLRLMPGGNAFYSPQQAAHCRKKALPLKGDFCARLFQTLLIATKEACGRLPRSASETAASGVLRGFGRAVWDE